jgi:hypothetical protein
MQRLFAPGCGEAVEEVENGVAGLVASQLLFGDCGAVESPFLELGPRSCSARAGQSRCSRTCLPVCWSAGLGRARAREDRCRGRRSGTRAPHAVRPRACCQPWEARRRCPGTGGCPARERGTAQHGIGSGGPRGPNAPAQGHRPRSGRPSPGRPGNYPSRRASNSIFSPNAKWWSRSSALLHPNRPCARSRMISRRGFVRSLCSNLLASSLP